MLFHLPPSIAFTSKHSCCLNLQPKDVTLKHGTWIWSPIHSYESCSVAHEAKMAQLPSDKHTPIFSVVGPIERAHHASCLLSWLIFNHFCGGRDDPKKPIFSFTAPSLTTLAYGKKYFWAALHHVAITKLASEPGAPPGGLHLPQ